MSPLLAGRFGAFAGPAAPAWWPRIEAAYSEPHRRYHTLAHLEAMFDEAAPFEPLARPLEWAIWFHDFVYDPRSAVNEEKSAVVAREALAELGEPEAVISRSAQLILATRHTALESASESGDAALLISLDLAILAAPAARYDAYVKGVRAEYAHVPDEQFRSGRAAFMRRFLAQAAIFPHPDFAGRERAARANIAREIEGAGDAGRPRIRQK